MSTPPTGRWSDPARVRDVAVRALRDRGVTTADEIVAVLLETSRYGVHTHGIRLLAAFLDELERGVAQPGARPTITADTGPVVRLDAGDALGVAAALHATTLVIERAGRYGVGVVGVRHSNHFGAAGAYARRIAAAGLAGIVTTAAAARVAPFGGIDPFFGTNPIAIAYGDDFCLDMATSQVCFNEIKARRAAGSRLAPGWAVDATGHGTDDPAHAVALSPLGGYKGQGLAMAVTVLTSVLVGGALDPEMEHIGQSRPGRGRDVTHLLIALDPAALGGREQAQESMRRLVAAVHDATPADPENPVLVPGDPQREHARRQQATGLEVDAATAALLDDLAAGVPATIS
jgi:ureidoglycolate dehydrogenase (NAD+)